MGLHLRSSHRYRSVRSKWAIKKGKGRERERVSARGEDLLPSEMSRSRRLILSIYRGSGLTQLFIRRECRLCFRGVLLSFVACACERGLEEERWPGDRWDGRRKDCATRLDSLTTFAARTRPRSSVLRTESIRCDLARCTYTDHHFGNVKGFPTTTGNKRWPTLLMS